MLLEVEQLIKKKGAPQVEINFVNDRLLHKLEQLANQLLPSTDETERRSVLVQYQVLRIFDVVLRCRLLPVETKATGSLIYLVNNVFMLHDYFEGTPLAKRMVARSKALLLFISKRSKCD